jgi:hypothetical protein
MIGAVDVGGMVDPMQEPPGVGESGPYLKRASDAW